MNNIKKIVIIFFSIFSFINTAHAVTIYNHNPMKIKTHVLMDQDNKYSYSFKIYNYNNENYNNFINLVVYGTLHLDSNVMSYFTLGYNFNQNNLKFVYHDIHVNPVNPTILGFYIKHIGLIEYGQDYNLIHDMNYFTRKHFYNDYNFQKKFKKNNVLYKMKNSITYRNKKFFGLIDHLTIALQYQYPNSNTYDNFYKSICSHLIQYDFKKIGISIASIYSADIYHYFDHKLIYNLNYKNESYALGIKYYVHKIHLACFYNKTINTRLKLNNTISYESNKNIEFCAEYKISPRFYVNIGYYKIYQMDNKFNNDKYLFTVMKQCKQLKSLNIFSQLNISLEYLYNKNIFLYFNDKINLENNKNFHFNVQDIKNIFQIGMIYFF